MNAFLEFLDKLKDLNIVKLFAGFFTQENFAPWLHRLQGAADTGNAAASAKSMLVWAVIIAVVIFAIDQIFYLTHPDQRDMSRRRWRAIEEGVGALGVSARTLIARARSMWINRGRTHRS